MSGNNTKAPTPPPTETSAAPAKQWTGSMAEKPATKVVEFKPQGDLLGELLKDPEIQAAKKEQDMAFILSQAEKKKGSKLTVDEKKTFVQKVEELQKGNVGWGTNK